MITVPVVSVVIPVRNGARFLADAIGSVLSQTLTDWELVVVDDGSSDESLALARRFTEDPRVRTLSSPPLGPSAARNLGLAHTSAPYITFLDADDRLRADALARFAALLDVHDRAALTYGESIAIDRDGSVCGVERGPIFARRPSGNALEALLQRNFIAGPGAVCVRRSSLAQSGPFRSELQRAEEWELWCRLALVGELIYAGPRPVLEKRWHEDSVGATLGSSPEAAQPCIDAVFSHPVVLQLGSDRVRRLRRRQQASMLAITATDRLKRHHTAAARRYLWAALKKHPQPRELVLFAATFIPGAPRALRPWLK